MCNEVVIGKDGVGMVRAVCVDVRDCFSDGRYCFDGNGVVKELGVKVFWTGTLQ